MQKMQLIALGFLFLLAMACEKTNESTDNNSTGKGGSLARFTISGNFLYLVDYATVEVYDISSKTAIKKNSVFVGFAIETIYPYKDKLFIGSQVGMYIYSIADPANPQRLGTARHVRSCDPVVANDSIAYVTLQGDGQCGAAQDALYIYNVKDVMNPTVLSILPLSKPKGLGLKDSVVFISRGPDGLTAVNVKDPNRPKELYTIKDANYVDVIPYDDLLICYVSNGVMLYDISDVKKIRQVNYIDNN